LRFSIAANPVIRMAAIFLTRICTFASKVEEIMEVKLYIGNMSYETTEEDLRTMLSEAGTVGSVDIIKDRDTGRPKGFAFVTMGSQVEAEKAISLFNEKMFNERPLTVNIARPREERQPGGSSRFSSGGSTHRSRGGSNKRY
jgi:RNA recognition motif-containing protein